jgi:hypothetical protein
VGLFQGKLGFDKVVLLRQIECEPFSNISGINEVLYDSNSLPDCFSKIEAVLKREVIISTETI